MAAVARACSMRSAGMLQWKLCGSRAQDAEAGGHQAAGVAGVDAFGEDLHLQGAGDVAAQRGGEPELVVVAGAGVQAHHQAHLAQARAQQVQVGRQVEGAAFLAGLDQADHAGARQALLVQRQQRSDGGVDRVAVVGAAAAVEQAVLVLGGPGAEVAAPAVEFGLLVEVAVHHHGVGAAGAGGGHLEIDHRRAAFEANDFQRQPGHLLAFHPRGGVAHHAVDVAVAGPVGIEHRALGRDGDVVGERGNDLFVPGALGKGGQRGSFVGLQRQQGITGVHGRHCEGETASVGRRFGGHQPVNPWRVRVVGPLQASACASGGAGCCTRRSSQSRSRSSTWARSGSLKISWNSAG
jgi:hypothetical protein